MLSCHVNTILRHVMNAFDVVVGVSGKSDPYLRKIFIYNVLVLEQAQ